MGSLLTFFYYHGLVICPVPDNLSFMNGGLNGVPLKSVISKI